MSSLSSSSVTQPLQELLNRLEERLSAVEVHLGVPSLSSSPSSHHVQVAPRIEAYDVYTTSFLAPFLAVCGKLGPEVTKYGDIIQRAFEGPPLRIL